MKKKTPFEVAVSLFPSKAAFARALGVSPCYINKMLREKHIPLEQCRPIEKATGGKVTAEQLRPDVFKRVA
jgi:DNA-binding transcriptional regulator YdaS (Cro superfamily)